MNFEQAERQAELVYEANVHLGEEEAQRLYGETILNLLADEDEDVAAAWADAVASLEALDGWADAMAGVHGSVAAWAAERLGAKVAERLAERLAELAAADADVPTTSAQYSDLKRQITDYDAWTEYVDPQGIVSEEQFHKMTPIEKLIIIQKVFGADATYADADDTASAR